MASVIEVRGLTRRFGDLLAVDHVSFSVEDGEIFGFLGPNGAGKTTTIRMLTGVIDPTEGTAAIEGHDICSDGLAAREHLGIVPEEANVYPDLSVWQNVMLMAELHGVPRKTRTSEGERLLGQLGLDDRKKEKARGLSKGLRQRLMLCTALVSRPEMLFLDEPTSGLDVHSAKLTRQIVADMNKQGLTVFLTTHNMDEADEMCHRVAIINKGRIAAIDTPENLRQAAKSSQFVEASFAGQEPSGADLRALSGVNRISRQGKSIRLYTEHPGNTAVALAVLADQQGLSVVGLRTGAASLEDIFLQLTIGTAREALE